MNGKPAAGAEVRMLRDGGGARPGFPSHSHDDGTRSTAARQCDSIVRSSVTIACPDSPRPTHRHSHMDPAHRTAKGTSDLPPHLLKQTAVSGEQSGLDALFDSGYSAGLISFNSATFPSASSIDHPIAGQQKQRETHTDSGLCIDSVDNSESAVSRTSDDPAVGLKSPTASAVRLDPRSLLPDDDGDTVLHLAIVKGLPRLISSIICQSPNPDLLDIADVFGQSPLHLASLTGQSRVVRQLVVSGAMVDLRNKFGNTALHIACENGDIEVAKSILKPISPCEVVDAQMEHYKPQIQGCNLMDMVHEMNYAGQTCVHLAASSGNRKLLEYMRSLGANFNLRDGTRGWTPLHWAVANGRLEVVQCLVRDCKVDLNVRCYAGHLPIKLAWNMTRTSPSSQSGKKIMMLLFEAGAKPSDQFLYSDDEESDFSSEDEDDDDNKNC